MARWFQILSVLLALPTASAFAAKPLPKPATEAAPKITVKTVTKVAAKAAPKNSVKSPLPNFDHIEFERYGQDSQYFDIRRGEDPELIGYQIKVARNPQRTVYGSVQLPKEHPICKRLDLLFSRKTRVRQQRMERRPASTWLTVKTHSKKGEHLYHQAFADKADAQLFNDLESLVRTSQQ